MRSRLREAHAREATPREAESLWFAVRAERIFDTAEQFEAYCEAAPWRIRVSERGDAAVLGIWREHLDVLAMRGVFCSPRHIAAFVADARALAIERGFGRVLSPLLPVDLLGPYRRETMSVCQRITPIQGRPRDVAAASMPLGVTLRAGCAEDLAPLVLLDAQCFDDFWRYGPSEFRELFETERLMVAEDTSGQLIGYTLATMSRGAVTLGRLGVAESARGHGLGRALVSEVARWSQTADAETMSLCTQEENTAARRMYAVSGLAEVRHAYGFAIGDAAQRGTA